MIKLDSVIVRQASDDFIAFQTASAMQSLSHVEVFAIVFQDCEPHGRWHVFAKFDSEQITTQHIDEAINLMLNPER